MKPPIIANAKYTAKFIKSADTGLTKVQKCDREYLLHLFMVLKNKYRGKVSRAPVDSGKRSKFRYTPRQMYNNAVRYMGATISAGQPLTKSGLGLFMGIDKATFSKLLTSNRRMPDEVDKYGFIYDCAMFIEMFNEYSAHKKQNPAGPIFILKNFGWTDRMEIEASSTGGALSEKERGIAQKRIGEFSEVK